MPGAPAVSGCRHRRTGAARVAPVSAARASQACRRPSGPPGQEGPLGSAGCARRKVAWCQAGDYAPARRVWQNVVTTLGSAGPSLTRDTGHHGRRASGSSLGGRDRPAPIRWEKTTAVAVKIKLKRLGKIRAPYYRIVVADARTKRDGRAIEEIGKYHPKSEPSLIEVDTERVQHWLSVGAQPTDPVRKIFEITGDWQKFKGLPGSEGTLRTAEPKADRKAAFAAAVAETLADGEAKPKAKTTSRPSRAKKAEAEPTTTAADKATAEKPAAEKPAAEKPAAEKPAAKKPADKPAPETAEATTAEATTAEATTAEATTAETTTEAAAEGAGEADGGS